MGAKQVAPFLVRIGRGIIYMCVYVYTQKTKKDKWKGEKCKKKFLILLQQSGYTTEKNINLWTENDCYLSYIWRSQSSEEKTRKVDYQT